VSSTGTAGAPRRPVELTLTTTEAMYDAIGAGARLPVRYLPRWPAVAKLDDVSYAALIGAALDPARKRNALVVLALVGIVTGLAAWTPRGRRSRGLRRAWIAACASGLIAALVWDDVAPLFAPEPEIGPDAAADARVLNVARFTQRRVDDESYELAHAFDVVQVEFTPVALGVPVRAAAAIDTGSVRPLAEGASVRVLYSAAAPRTVRLQGGTRHFLRVNAAQAARRWLVVVGVIVALLALAAWGARRRRSQRARADALQPFPSTSTLT
jgi:hypothetical protein